MTLSDRPRCAFFIVRKCCPSVSGHERNNSTSFGEPDLAGNQRAPDGQEFVSLVIAFVVRQEDAVAGKLGRIAADHDVEQQAAVAQPVERSGLPRPLIVEGRELIQVKVLLPEQTPRQVSRRQGVAAADGPPVLSPRWNRGSPTVRWQV